MSLFRTLGERVERMKQKYSEDPDAYCEDCEEPLTQLYETCPHCGSDQVVAAK